MVELIADSVTVEFPIYDANSRSLRSHLLNVGSGGRLKAAAGQPVIVTALEDISFSLRDGDRLGLVGCNGAGKTTLLRTLAGIYTPVRGRVIARGRVAPMFDIALGMDPDATGYENIRIRGLFLDLSSEEIDEITPDIAEFSGLGPYLDVPIRTYSAGMRVRLAFAIATAIEPEILLLDEMIGAGDAAFMEKAQQRLHAFLHRTRVMILASHSNDTLRQMCNKALLMHEGKVVGLDSVEEVLDAYASLTEKAS